MALLCWLVSYAVARVLFMRRWEICPYETPGALRGRPLRYVLVYLLRKAHRKGGGALTVQELIAGCESAGVVFDSRASKLISDALRWEVRRGRVIQLARGVYVFGSAPRSTLWRIRKRTTEYMDRLGELRVKRFPLAARIVSGGVSQTRAASPMTSVIPLLQ